MLIFLAVFAMLATSAFALDGTVTYPAQPYGGSILLNKSAPDMVAVDEEFNVTIRINNTGDGMASVVVDEFLPNVEPIDPLPEYTDVKNDSDLIVQPPRLSWSFDLMAGQSRTLVYTVKPMAVGTIAFGPTELSVPGGKFYSNGLLVDVGCSPSPGCNESIGETALSCPEKCGLGPNATTPEPPEAKPIPTPAYAGPEEAVQETDYTLAIAAIVVIAALGMYLILRRRR